MTLSTSDVREQYVGNGVTVVFGFSFKIFAATEIKVYSYDLTTEIETLLTKDVDYTVTFDTDAESGSIDMTLAGAPDSNTRITIVRVGTYLQDTDFTENDPFPASTSNNRFDKNVMMIQELKEQLGRAIKFGNSSASSGITVPEPLANYVLGWDSAGDDLINKASAGEISVTAFAQTLLELATAGDWLDELGFSALAQTLLELTTAGDWLDELGFSTFIQTLIDAVDAATARATIGAAPIPNLAINPTFCVAQDGTTYDATTTPANNDDTYVLDHWILLSDGNDIVDVTRQEDAPTGGRYCIRLDVETVDKKFGVFHPIEKSRCATILGGTASLSFAAKTDGSGKLDNLKAAVVAWDSTADTITSDIVSAWGAEDTNPTLVANWTYENTPVNLNPTTSWATYKIEGVSIDTASAANVGVFIWSDVTDTDAGDYLYITNVKLEEGSVVTGMTADDFDRAVQLPLVQYRYLKGEAFKESYNAAGTTVGTKVMFPVEMVDTPAISHTHLNGSNVDGIPLSFATTARSLGVRETTSGAGYYYFSTSFTADKRL
jgi:hypothetical protein